MRDHQRWQVEMDTMEKLAEALVSRAGIDYRGARLTLLASTVQRRLKALGLNQLEDYATYLNHSPEEWQELINQISITETTFYRHTALVEGIMDALSQLHRSYPPGQALHIWSAATATGQEAYTLAMAAMERGLPLLRPVVVWGSDINTRALTQAQEARYPPDALTSLPRAWQEAYMIRNPDGTWSPNSQVRRLVRFFPFNLISLLHGKRPPFTPDLIVCINVLIYFPSAMAKQVLRALAQLLPNNGCLFVDSAVAYLAREILQPIKIANVHAYRLPLSSSEERQLIESTTNSPREHPTTGKTSSRFRQQSDYKYHASGKGLRAIGRNEQQTQGASPMVRSWDEFVKLIRNHRWQEVEKALLARQQEEPLAFEPYFLLARLYRMQNNLQKARKYYERALYLCPSLSVAHLEYGNLLKLLGDVKGAYQAYRRATQAARGDFYSHRYGFPPRLAARMAQRALSTLPDTEP